jgi:hypothetical protein
MYEISTTVSSNECLDCIEKAVSKDWSGFITCAATILVGVVVRAIEKRKLKKDSIK